MTAATTDPAEEADLFLGTLSEQDRIEHERLSAELDAEEFEGGYPWPNL